MIPLFPKAGVKCPIHFRNQWCDESLQFQVQNSGHPTHKTRVRYIMLQCSVFYEHTRRFQRCVDWPIGYQMHSTNNKILN
jgi:hypothetical protein